MKISQINRQLVTIKEVLLKEAEKYNGMIVTIPLGKFKGKKGKIQFSRIELLPEVGVMATICPINIKDGTFLDTKNVDARTFWSLENVVELKNK